mgnify:CR=1 FL=1
MSTIRITITSGEWHRAFHDVGHFCGDDEQTVAGQLLLTVADGTRTWSAGEPRCLATLACTAGPGPELETLLSPRLVGAACALTGDDDEAVDLFLAATKAGLFHLHWSLVCPLCGDAVQSFASLRNIRADFNCTLCQNDTQTRLDDFVHVSFVVTPDVRAIAAHHPEALSAADSTEATSSFSGVIGTTTFDSKGDLQHGVISLYNYKGGKKSLLDEVKM